MFGVERIRLRSPQSRALGLSERSNSPNERLAAANGDPKQALEHARKALAQAPDDLNKQSLTAMVAALEAGKPGAQ